LQAGERLQGFESGEVETMSVAFTREESAETAAEVELPDRPISPHPNLVTVSGLDALTNAMRESRTAYDAAQRIEDADERRRAVALASRKFNILGHGPGSETRTR
jgi:hypothetical protein